MEVYGDSTKLYGKSENCIISLFPKVEAEYFSSQVMMCQVLDVNKWYGGPEEKHLLLLLFYFFMQPAEECIAEDLEDDLNKTLSVNAGLLFVLDESGSVSRPDFQKTKEFVKDIVSTFP